MVQVVLTMGPTVDAEDAVYNEVRLSEFGGQQGMHKPYWPEMELLNQVQTTATQELV